MTPRRAFTLVELLVAAALTAALAGGIIAVVRNVATTWTRAASRLDTATQARLVLDQLELDFQAAQFRDDGNVWLAADVLNGATGGATGLWQTAPRNPKPAGGLSLQMNAPSFPDARFGTAGVWLRFFTTSRGANTASAPATISAPVAVGYQIIRRFSSTNPADLATAYLLHRAEVRPAASGVRPGVLESGYNLTAAAYTTSSAANNGATTGDPRSLQVPGGPRGLDAVIASNVIDFGVRAYVRDLTTPGGLRLIFPANAAGAFSNNAATNLRATLPPSTPPAQWGAARPCPEVIDVMVRILTDEGARLIANMERIQTPALVVPAKYNGSAPAWWWGIAEENSQVYTRRIVRRAQPL